MAELSYATSPDSPSPGGIGWVNFGPGFRLVQGETKHMTHTFIDGSTVTFDLLSKAITGGGSVYNAVTTPTWDGAAFGHTGYASVKGEICLYNERHPEGATETLLSITNIKVNDHEGNPIPIYHGIIADAETLNQNTGLQPEKITLKSFPDVWEQLIKLPATKQPGSTGPTIEGVGEDTVIMTARDPLPAPAAVLMTKNPTSMTASIYEPYDPTEGPLGGIAIGFSITKVAALKDIQARLNPEDQFNLNISGKTSDSKTTSGSTTGLQPVVAYVYSDVSQNTPATAYTINEAMAPGSVGSLSGYTVTVLGRNLTPATTALVAGTLPITITPMLGDNIVYTMTNMITPITAIKKVDKMDVGLKDIITYSVDIKNPNNGIMSGVNFTDKIALGTTFEVGSLTVINATFTGTAIETGIVLNRIPASSTATVSWKVKVGDTEPNPNPIRNTATLSDPTKTQLTTNEVQTKVNYADLLSEGNFVKIADKAGVEPNGILTYTLTIKNTGNVPANHIVLTDALPENVMYVDGSLIGDVGVSGNPMKGIVLKNPLQAGQEAKVSFKVQAPSSIPKPNLILNQAHLAHTYTTDSTNPDNARAEGDSNVVEVAVKEARLEVQKVADKKIAYIGDTIKYSILLKNTGNVEASQIVLTDLLPLGVSYVAGSLQGSVTVMGEPKTGITLVNPLAANQRATISFELMINEVPNPNPIKNRIFAKFTYMPDSQISDSISGEVMSSVVTTFVPRYNFGQQINDLINSIAFEEAALSAIEDAEANKIKAMAARDDVTTQQLMCVNKSVTETLDSIIILEGILKQKLNALQCQINGPTC